MIVCPACAAEIAAADKFCGACGIALSSKPTGETCPCGADPADVDADGYCLQCGRKNFSHDRQESSREQSHEEYTLSENFAAITDRGRRHARNEDAVALAETPDGFYKILIVSDGVSSSRRPHEASQCAVAVARDACLKNLQEGFRPREALKSALQEAQNAVAALAAPHEDNPPATTIVAAVVAAANVDAADKPLKKSQTATAKAAGQTHPVKTLTLAWAGDSRAYFLRPQAQLLTRDDSWANEMTASGKMSREEAMRHKYAHAITQCLGGLRDEETLDLHVETREAPAHGLILLCSDGLWNYAEEPGDLRKIIEGEAVSARDLCRKLIDFANAAGGHDNISAAILRY